MNGTEIFKNLRINGNLTDLICTDGKIAAIGRTDLSGTDMRGMKTYPGLIDIHTHGRGGFDAMDGALSELSALQAKCGVTSFLPTTMTAPPEKLKALFDKPIPKNTGAQILGFHLEGPYISEKYKGAQNPKFICPPDIRQFKEFKNIKMATIAPELSGAVDFIKNTDSIISVGHTGADYDTAVSAFRAGAKCVTHTFNAMPPLHHRMPSVIGAAFDENAYVQLICDGIHVHPSAVRILYRLFGADRLILISDSMRAAGLPDGDYEFGALTITVRDKIARTQDGALAGSTSSLLDCVKAAVSFGIPEADAFKAASETPARLLGVNKGVIAPGYDCDLLILDENNDPFAVITAGKTQFINSIH